MEASPSQLIVRDIEEEVLAAHHDACARVFKAALLSMPDIGDDADFVRQDDLPRGVEQ